jgi:uncharacterized membrane protein (DUF4010 family)
MTLDARLIDFVLTVTLSFIIGMEIKTYAKQFQTNIKHHFYGSARTVTFIGMLGFVFYIIDPKHLFVYIFGATAFTLLYTVLYIKNVSKGNTDILFYLAALGVYALGPMSVLFPIWMPTLLFVLIVFILNARTFIQKISQPINTYEFETLGKMVLLSIVILPLLPDKNIIPYLPLSPFKIWMAVAIISAISYGGYIAQKYFFRSKGFFLTGIIGGTYSSTATTVVLAKKARTLQNSSLMTSAMIVATSMMYLRLIVVAFIFNHHIALHVVPTFLIFAAAGFVISYLYYRLSSKKGFTQEFVDKNPLELTTALIFATLFVVMIIVTHFVTHTYGANGLKLLSFIVGFTDIDPFILSLLTGKYTLGSHEILSAIIISAGSNNILKAIYALWFGGWKEAKFAFGWLLVLGLGTIGVGLI